MVWQAVGHHPLETVQFRESPITVPGDSFESDGLTVRALISPNLDPAQHPGEILPEFPQPGIIGHEDQLGCGVEDSRGLLKPVQNQSPLGKNGGDEVLGEIRGDALPQLGIQGPGRVFVQGSEGLNRAIRALKANGGGLEAAAPLGWREAPSKPFQVQDFHPHGHSP